MLERMLLIDVPDRAPLRVGRRSGALLRRMMLAE
jgi:hypothetical protein